MVAPRETVPWDEFSGRLEAVERVDMRSRVAGAVQAVHFREGALVKQGDLLITIDPAPYAAEVERAEGAGRRGPGARVAAPSSELERGQRLSDARTIAQRELDERINASARPKPTCAPRRPRCRRAQLNLDYTQVRAPVAGRVGKLEITVGNLVAAGPGAPVLTTLVSVNPIYASFDADEQVVTRALEDAAPTRCGALRRSTAFRCRWAPAPTAARRYKGRLQLIDNQVDAQQRHGARARRVRQRRRRADARPVRPAADGPGEDRAGVLISERAVGTDQNKKFVMVVDADNKAEYREVDARRPSSTACAS